MAKKEVVKKSFHDASVLQFAEKVARRNRQIRHQREKLRELSDFLGDAKIEPALPDSLSRWLYRECMKK